MYVHDPPSPFTLPATLLLCKIYLTRKKPTEVGEKLTQNQKSIIQGIIDNPYVSARELSKIVGISSRKIEDNIKKLKALGVLMRIGPPKGGYWEIIQESKGKSE